LSALDHFNSEFEPYYVDDDGSLFAFALALAAMFEPVEQCVRAGDDPDAQPPLSQMLDPYRCPDFGLEWLAQFPGQKLIGSDPASWRRQIASPSNWNRGSVPHIRAAVAETLIGSRTVLVFERQPGVWSSGENISHYTVATIIDETPTSAATAQAVADTTPSGKFSLYQSITRRTYASVMAQFATYADAMAAYATYQAAEDGP
jgi:hypothetical protein